MKTKPTSSVTQDLTEADYALIDQVAWRRGLQAHESALVHQRSRFKKHDSGSLEDSSPKITTSIAFLKLEDGEIVPVVGSPDGYPIRPFPDLRNPHSRLMGLILDRRQRSEFLKGILAYIESVRSESRVAGKLTAATSYRIWEAGIHGSVVEHLDEVVVVRFNVAGEVEEREFFWDELNATPETLPVGSAVIGETRLLRAPIPPSEQEQDAEFQKARDQILRDLKSQGIDPKAMIGSEDTAELREKSARVWAENLKNPSPTQSNGG